MSAPAKQILDGFGSGVLVVGLDDRIIYMNRALAGWLGTEPAEWEGRNAAEFARFAGARTCNPHGFTDTLASQQDAEEIRSRDLEWKTESGVLHVREDSVPFRDESGRVAGRLFAYHDISREKAIDRMKSEFIAVASHELRTPMTSIKGSVDLILSGFAGDISAETQELLEIAQKNCDRLIRLINDILDLAKIEAGQIKLRKLPMDLTEAVQRAMRGVKSLADQEGVTLTLLRPEVLPLVEVDKDRIEQVVTNLLSNAIKFSPANEEVRVELSIADAWVMCTVIDKGCGIPESDLNKVFGKFQQVGAQAKGGTGLGLAIAQALVNEHKGKVWVESRVNEGTRFIFTLPAMNSPASN